MALVREHVHSQLPQQFSKTLSCNFTTCHPFASVQSLTAAVLFASAGMADSIQKEAFRKYLESAGVIDALTKGDTSLLQAPYSCRREACIHYTC